MSGEVLEVLPLGPFPPRGPGARGARLDLGGLLRDELLCRPALEGPCRSALQARLGSALEARDHGRSAELLELWIDTWPVSGAVDPARSEWSAQPSPEALAVLGRASEIAVAALGWATIPGTPWPLPPEEWLQGRLEGKQLRLLGRGRHDLREVVEGLVGRAVDTDLGDPLPPLLEVAGAELAARRAELAAALVREEAAAVLVTAPVPSDPATQLALGELRMEGPAQRAVERYGPGAAWVDGVATWSSVLEDAPAGEAGDVLVPTAEGLLTPGTPTRIRREGPHGPTGWLVWTAPWRPIPVQPVAVHVLHALDGERGTAAIAEHLQGPLDGVQQVLDALVDLGAATAA